MADHKGEPLRRYAFAEVEMITPLKFTRVEAEIFVRFWEEGLLAGIGFMHSAGGSSPVTLAGTVALDVASSLFINILYRLCYGFKKLWMQTNSSVLDMRRGMFAFGRPERALITLANGQIARRLNAGFWGSAVYPDAKLPGVELGMQSAFSAVPSILAGSLGLECFGIVSGGEAGSPLQLVIDNEYAGALKRFARGMNVNDDTLAFDLLCEVGPGGMFTDTEHTATHFPEELWRPGIFSTEALNSWLAGDRKTEMDRAREACEEILRTHHPRGIDEATDKALLAVIEHAKRDLL